MANVSHASLTGSEVHEPKGITGAALGTVYVSNGAGSGSWSSIGTSAFTGMVADFLSPVAPAGWLELDGSVISTTTYSALYGAMSLTTSGTRTNGSGVITSIPDTSSLRVGYYAFGTGIASGTTILSVDSATQVTLSANSSSSGSGSVVFSPWLLNTGTIKLPDLTTAGRYRRSRTASTKPGDLLADQNQAHTHSGSTLGGVADTAGLHTHANSLSDPGHSHTVPVNVSFGASGSSFGIAGQVSSQASSTNFTGISINNAAAGSHAHSLTISGNTGSSGSSEARPVSIVLITCVKT